MKIKTKKQLKLPQLIDWAWENKIKNRAFYSNTDGGSVYFDKDGDVYVEHEIAKTETFTVEVEEEITEDTEFKELICLDVDDDYFSYEDVCVSDFDEDRVRAIYIPNKDLTMTLIWRDGKLVD